MMYDVPIFFFDLETTGIDIDTSRIVQIAFTDGDKVESLVLNPQQPIDEGASKVHGYYDKDVADCKPFADYAERLHKLADGRYWGGYNNFSFDIPIFQHEFERVGIEPPKPIGVFDAFKVFTHFHGFAGKGSRTLQAAHVYYCGSQFDGAHDAKADILATKAVMERQIETYGDLKDLEKFVEISQKRSMNIDKRGFFKFNGTTKKAVCGCGKFCGTELEKIPLWYFNWILKQPSFSDEVKKVASNAIIGVFPKYKD